MEIVIASDHQGFSLKEEIKHWLAEWGYPAKDLGPAVLNPDDDYPDFVSLVAKEVSKAPAHVRGIVLGSSGQGEAMVANRYPDVRAAVYYGGQESVVMLSREHNDANVLSLGASFISVNEARQAIKLWLETPFSGQERHIRRIRKIERS